MVKCEFLFDFGSPNAYCAYKVLPEIERRTAVKFTTVPVLLGGIFKATNNQSPAITLQGIKNKPDYQQIEMRRFLDRHGLTAFQFNPHFPVNTLQVMRGAVAAQMEGFLPDYVAAVMHYMWEDPLKMDDPEIIRTALNQAGLDGAHILDRCQDPAVKKQLIDNTDDAVNRGAFGIPTYFIDGEIYFGKDTLRDVEEEILLRKGV